jgi:protein AbiQ
MNKITFCRIKIEYIKYLWSYDNKVQYNEKEPEVYTEQRPYIGIVLVIDGLQYFAPLEHPRVSHQTLKPNPHILKINEGRHGLIAFNNMIPVNNSELVSFNFENECNQNYKNILKSQFIFCSKNKIKINDHAKATYNKVVIDKNPFFISVCCDFKLLEEKCNQYKCNQYK